MLSGLHGHGTCDSLVRCQVCFCHRHSAEMQSSHRQVMATVQSVTATAYRETASGPPAERFWRARQRVAAGRGSRVSAHCLRGPSSHTAVAPCAAAGNPWGGISGTGDGDTLFGKCLRSSHHPEAVHLHLNTYPSESGAAPLLVGSGLMFWPSSRWPGCKHESCRRRVLPAATGLHVVVSGAWQACLARDPRLQNRQLAGL